MLKKLIETNNGLNRKLRKKRGCYFAGWYLVTFLALLGGGWPAESQAALSCSAMASIPPTARGEGLAERVGDLILTCNGGTSGIPLTADFQIFLNTGVASKLLNNDPTPATEALLLLNEPAPVLQVLGVNVFRGLKASANSIIWPGITFAPDSAGKAIFRMTNIRADASDFPPGPLPATIQALISSPGLPITSPTQILGFAAQGLIVSTSEVTTGSFKLNFRENFPTAFMKKIEVDTLGFPISQNVPGLIYSNESGFTTNFSGTDAAGRANTGTRLVARFKNLPTGTSLIVPIKVQSTNSALLARLMSQVNPDYSGGHPASTGSLPLCQNSTHAVYEIEGLAGITGANVIDTFSIPVIVLGPSGFDGGVVNGNLGPISGNGVMTLEAAPEPRFVDQALEAFPWLSCLTYLPLTIK